MSECMIHQLTFGPVPPWEPGQLLSVLIKKPADVADFLCPACGLKLFVYYRTMPREKAINEYQQEGDTK